MKNKKNNCDNLVSHTVGTGFAIIDTGFDYEEYYKLNYKKNKKLIKKIRKMSKGMNRVKVLFYKMKHFLKGTCYKCDATGCGSCNGTGRIRNAKN